MRMQLMPVTLCLLVAAVLSSQAVVAQERAPGAGGSSLSLQVDDSLWDNTNDLAPALLPRRSAVGSGFREEATSTASAAQQPVAFEYSDAYRVRARLHRIASFATLPLFATELVLGQSLYNDPTEGKKSAHLAVATGMGVLFGVNSVTGVWNLVEARRDPNGRGRRWLHGVLMLAADAGFFATAALAPSDDEEEGRVGEGGGSRSTHRAVAFTSIGIASAGYLVMLIGGR
jgi:hypothetical protein